MNPLALTVERFTKELADGSPTPGGGSVSALTGALSAALCAMVARLTLGREKYREHWDAMDRLRIQADALAARLLDLVDKDAQAYNRVLDAFRMPKQDEAQRAVRLEAIQDATREAARVPLATLQAVAEIAGLAEEALDKGNPNALTDAGVAVQLMRAAAWGAAYNMRINLASIEDEAFNKELSAAMKRSLDRVLEAVTRLEAHVENGLG